MELAQLTIPGISGTIDAPSGIPTPSNTSAGNVLGFVLGGLLAIAVIGSVGLLIWGSIGWITSQGDKQKLEKARKTIVAAIIGLVIVLLSFVIIAMLGRVLGIQGWMDITSRK